MTCKAPLFSLPKNSLQTSATLMSMALFSAPPLHLPTLSSSKHHTTHKLYPFLSFKKPHLSFSVSPKAIDNGSGAVTVEPENAVKVEESNEASLGSNGSSPVAYAGAPVPETVRAFQDPRWVGGTWDLKQFQKDGVTHWDSVIDAEVRRRKWLEDNPESSSNEDPVLFDTSIIPWWAWMKRFHLPEAELLNVPPNSTCQPRDHATENVHQTVIANLSHVYTNGTPLLQPYMQTAIDASAHARRLDGSSNMLLAQSSNLGMLLARGGMIKSEAGYSGNLPFMYGTGTNILEAHPGITDPSVSFFSSVESDSQPINETVLDADTFSFGFLGQNTRNFSLSDLTDDFSNSSVVDKMESYSRSAFLATDVNNFLEPQDKREHQVGLATIASLVVIIPALLCNTPLAKLQHKFQSNLIVAQDDRLKAISAVLVNMNLKLYSWETHFKSVIENFRRMEEKWLSAVQM